MRLAALRAVELRRDLGRSVNLGVTSWIDAEDESSRYDDLAPGSLLVEPALLEGPPTLFARYGDWPPLGAIVEWTASAALARHRKRAASRAQ